MSIPCLVFGAMICVISAAGLAMGSPYPYSAAYVTSAIGGVVFVVLSFVAPE